MEVCKKEDDLDQVTNFHLYKYTKGTTIQRTQNGYNVVVQY